MGLFEKIVSGTLFRKGQKFPDRPTSYGVTQPFINYLVFDNTPHWVNLQGMWHWLERYQINPVLNACIQLKVRESGNKRIVVKNRRTGQIEPRSTGKSIPKKCYQLFDNPNPLQSTKEFFQQRKAYEQIFGNKFTYANTTLGFQGIAIERVSALWNVPPYAMQYKLTGKYFSATTINDIIKGWKFEYGNHKQEWEPWEVLHQNNPNLDIRDGLIFGRPVQASLSRPLSNIEMSYESRNVLMKNRGMRAIISSGKSDASGSVALQPTEKEELQKEIEKYGMLENQFQFLLTNQPVNVTIVDQDVRKLGLFEEITTDGLIVANAHGVPDVLLKLDMNGATYENQEASVRRLYQGTLIPEDEEDFAGLNKFLGLTETEWEVCASYDHIPFLQANKKEEAESRRAKSSYMKDLFMAGAVTHNEWLQEIGLNAYPDGDKRIWDFTPDQIAIIVRSASLTPDNQNENQNQVENSNQNQNGKMHKNGKPVLV